MFRETCLLRMHYDPVVVTFVKELSATRSLKHGQHWRELLNRDYQHKIFSSGKITKKKVVDEEKMEEEDLDDMVEQAFAMMSEEEEEEE